MYVLYRQRNMKKSQIGQFVKTKPIQTQTKPIYRGEASGEAGSNPISPPSPLCLLQLFAVGGRTEKIMLFKSLSGKCRLKIMFALYPIIW